MHNFRHAIKYRMTTNNTLPNPSYFAVLIGVPEKTLAFRLWWEYRDGVLTKTRHAALPAAMSTPANVGVSFYVKMLSN